MQSRNRQTGEKGSVLVETLIGSVVLMLITLFTIDISQTTYTLYRINYLTKKFARRAGVSSGKSLAEVKRKLRQALLTNLFKDLRSGRVKSIEVSFLDQRGEKLSDRTHIECSSLFTLRVEARMMTRFVPYRLFAPLTFNSGAGKVYLSEGSIVYETDVTFIAE